MNDEAIITALLANLGDPKELVHRAKNVEVPKASGRGMKAFERKYVLIGRAVAHQQMIKFLTRIQKASEAEKARKSEQSKEEQPLAAGRIPPSNSLPESQYKSASSFHLRNQTAFPSNIGPTTSFGGAVDWKPKSKRKRKKRTPKEELELKLDDAFRVVDEEVSMKHGESMIAAERGRFIVNGEVIIDNHADLLKILVMWLVDNRPEVLQSAIDGIADMVQSGTAFRK